MDSGCNDSREMRRVWMKLVLQARRAARWLDQDIAEPFGTALPNLGDGSVTGATRSKIVVAMENMQVKVLEKALSQVRPKSTREAWSWRQRDKVASAWTLAMPTGATYLSDAEFSEACASSLCVASPACQGRVGEPIRE